MEDKYMQYKRPKAVLVLYTVNGSDPLCAVDDSAPIGLSEDESPFVPFGGGGASPQGIGAY